MMSARRLQLTDLVSMGQVSMVILCCHGCASHFCMELLSTSSKKRFSSYQKFSDPTCFSMILFSIKLEWNIDLSLLCARPGIEPAFLFSHHEASIRAVSSDVKLHHFHAFIIHVARRKNFVLNHTPPHLLSSYILDAPSCSKLWHSANAQVEKHGTLSSSNISKVIHFPTDPEQELATLLREIDH